MKTLLTFLSIVAVVFQSVAQTDNAKVEYKTITTTNWVKPGPYLRVLDGVTYSVAYSQKWKKFSDWEQLGVETLDPVNEWTKIHFVLGNYQIISNVTFITIQSQQMKYDFNDRYNPNILPQPLPPKDDHIVAVLHCEHPDQADFYCIKTKDVLDGKGVAFRAYDCGVQATNLVPVIEKKKIKVISTNSVANQP